jgi:hypothetical protein
MPPVKARIINLTNGTLTISNGNLAEPLVYSVTLSTNNVVSKVGDTPTNSFSLTFTNTTGEAGISFRPTGSTTNKTGRGTVLQNGTNAAGWFLGADQSGSFILQ